MNILPQGEYIAYLRKSRMDVEAERHGEGETLARHETMLRDLAARYGVKLSALYREIVSGETIAARPEMQRLLDEVEAGRWAGVFVVEVERLARGDTIDQGMVARAFGYSGTLIITPMRVYNPNDPADVEYFEFGLFMSRREYQTIRRRMYAGSVAAVKQGKWPYNGVPYGWTRTKSPDGKGYILVQHPEQAPIVADIGDWYAHGIPGPDGIMVSVGTTMIARRLDAMGIPAPTQDHWSAHTIQNILRNPVHAGYVSHGRRGGKKQIIDGAIVVTRPRSAPDILAKGMHTPIWPEQLWQDIQTKLMERRVSPNNHGIIHNPLAGLVVCGICGRKMVQRIYDVKGTHPQKDPRILCPNQPNCHNASAKLPIVEARVLDGLAAWLSAYKIRLANDAPPESSTITASTEAALAGVRGELKKLTAQRNKLHDLLEQGVYDIDTFRSRVADVSQRIQSAEAKITALEATQAREQAREVAQIEIIPRVEDVLRIYSTLPSPSAKNDALKSVIQKVTYTKVKDGRYKGTDPLDFDITIFPRLPDGLHNV